MRKSTIWAAVLLCAVTWTQAFSQISNATVSGNVPTTHGAAEPWTLGYPPDHPDAAIA